MDGKQQPAAKSPLDQLQAALNTVLEHTGHVFVEANRGGDKDRAAAAAAKLRAVIPNANDTFHNALDELEAQLATARWVLTRDLAALRQKQAATTSPTTNGAKPHDIGMNDVDMSDAPPLPTTEIAEPETDNIPKVNGDTSKADESKPEPPKVNPDLSIDTSAKPDETNQPEPNTAMSVMDFDSLFNDPASATGSNSVFGTPKADDAIKEESQQPVAERAPQPTTADRNEGMSSLLAGLESYANAAGDGAIDLSTPVPSPPETKPSEIKTDQPQPQPEQQQQQQQQQQPEQAENKDDDTKRDTTFDDLVNFADFDFSSFGDGTGFDDGGGTTFDENFFNIE
ncbi:hypothetical protein K461DRAFT_288994 [Myriangium duriaei CBS 260.36]|uniref:Uncharacterized protein n=1 Tax=Myriangium duriaei CBS 260.36 TaxID=1168546 RepID=A0A9P4JCP4_9PEZI|nr:hypothetical protein K461DRAFT_288994 [Myriangium duriaei CBS 260.36]